MTRSRSGEAGFSLAELMVAMVVTTIVSGAIYGMMMMAQKSFHREPEVAERQQNIRMAMDLIMRDLSEAAVGLAPPGEVSFVQVFSHTSTLESGGALNDCAGNSSMDGTPGQGECPDSAIFEDQKVDDLEMITNTSAGCPAETTCAYPGRSNVLALSNLSGCVKPDDVVLVLMANGTWTVRAVQRNFANSGGRNEGCPQERHTALGFNSNYGPPGLNPAPPYLCNPDGIGTAGDEQLPGRDECLPKFVSRAQVVTYHVRDCNDGSGLTCLWRRATGSLSSVAGFDNFYGGFDVVARGIDDLQVQYATAAAPDTWVNDAPRIGILDAEARDFGKMTIKVRVTLSGRAADARLTGATEDAQNRSALRGQLTSVAAIRATLSQVATDTSSNLWQ